MSLLSEAMENCIFLDKTTGSDGYGGVRTTWREGAEFLAAFVFHTSIEARRAEKEGVKDLYDVITPRTVTLMYGDVFRRMSDGKLFKATADSTDKKTPSSSSLDMRVVKAEELEFLPN